MIISNPISKQIFDLRYSHEGEAPTEALHRVANYLGDTEEERLEFFEIMDKGLFFPAGRVTTNAGLNKDLTMGNCYTLGSIPDSMEGIMDMAKLSALTQKAGGGVGYDFSSLRPKGASTSNEAVASGPVSFIDIYNSVTGTILQGNRRGASMGIISIYHPDVLEWVHCKDKSTTALQYFNLSVMVDDEFMQAVEDDKEIDLHYPVYDEDFHILKDQSKWTHHKKIRARELWDKIMWNAYYMGDPGIFFYDTLNRYNNTSYCETIIGTNPCGPRKLAHNRLSI